MRIAVTGASGQLALSLRERGAIAGHDIVAIGRSSLDLARSGHGDAFRLLSSLQPDAVINAAAYTAVDQAEREPDVAFAINAEGAGAVATACSWLKVPLVHLSTDYVFDGGKLSPYLEDDGCAPIGVYGTSKRGGEVAVLASGADVAILRTAWVYSPFGNNFVKTMLALARTRDTLNVVDDQHGCPTSALDLADAVLQVARNLMHSKAPDLRGLFHATGQGETSWAGFAQAIFASAAALGQAVAHVLPIPTSAYPTLARRPLNSRLDCQRLAERHGVTMPAWQDSTRRVVRRLTHPSFEGTIPS